MKHAELRFLRHVAEQEVHWDGACTSMLHPRRFAESLRVAGLLDPIHLRIMHGDGWHAETERYRDGYCMTREGLLALQAADPEAFAEIIAHPAMPAEKARRWVRWTTPIEPSCDCPTCPDCTGPTGSLCRDDGREAPAAGWLQCICCGHEWEATPAELAQAEAADRAYAEAQDREAAAHG